MTSSPITRPIARARLAEIADWLVVAVAVSLPWSTSATSILLVLWLIAVVPSFEWSELRQSIAIPAAGLAIALFLFAALGMLWAHVSLYDRWQGLNGFLKLLPIPLLVAQFRRSNNGPKVFIGFLVACLVLLAASWIVTIWPQIPKESASVPVKSYMAQSLEFSVCAAVLLYIAVERARARLLVSSAILLFISLAFLFDVFFFASSRTTIGVVIGLVLAYGIWRGRWKGIAWATVSTLLVAAMLWISSPYLRQRVGGLFTEAQRFETKGTQTSTGERIVFWTKSLQMVASAPVIGHGTGSIPKLFRESDAGRTGVDAEFTNNPHNESFVVAIQLGLLGVAIFWAMWISQLMLFREPGLFSWIGVIVVVQNIIGSIGFSLLSDFTEGWLYAIGLGVTAGIVLRHTDKGTLAAPIRQTAAANLSWTSEIMQSPIPTQLESRSHGGLIPLV